MSIKFVKKVVEGKEVLIGVDTSQYENIYVELVGELSLNTSGDADSETNLRDLNEFINSHSVEVSSDFKIVSVDKANDDFEVGQTIRLTSKESGVDLDYEDEWAVVTICDSNNNRSERNVQELIDSLEEANNMNAYLTIPKDCCQGEFYATGPNVRRHPGGELISVASHPFCDFEIDLYERARWIASALNEVSACKKSSI